MHKRLDPHVDFDSAAEAIRAPKHGGRCGLIYFSTMSRRAIEREIAVAADPVERMPMQLTLMRYYEGQKDLQHARKVVEALPGSDPNGALVGL